MLIRDSLPYALGSLLTGVLVPSCVDLGGSADTDEAETADDDTNPDDSSGSSSDTDDDSSGNSEFDFPDAQDASEVTYRALDGHPGCSTSGLSYEPADIAGYTCAAKAYPVVEDTDKPIVLLIHGNSDSPLGWERFDPMGACDMTLGAEGSDQLAEILTDNGFRTLAVDMRFDLVDDPDDDNDVGNAAKNMDHGWGVPIAQHFIRSMMEANPDRRFVLVGFSFGVTTIRDSLRRLLVNDGFNAFAQLDDVFLLAGGNHGVSSFALCGVNPTMRGTVTCEMGNRAAYSPTYFTEPLNGPGGAFETPCGDGETAFGEAACDGATIEYTTIVMEDLPNGEQQDLFVSEASARLEGADNRTIGLNEFDQTNYFFCGLLRNHFGAARHAAAHRIMGEKLGFEL